MIHQSYNLASDFKRGPSFWASMMLPAILSLPFMKAVCGFRLPEAMASKSSSDTVMVTSGLPLGLPSNTAGVFRSKAAM